MFRRHDYRHPPPFRPNMPFGPNMIKEMSQLVFLWNISEAEDGITGYELQKNYNVKQTNVYRILKEMEDEGYLTSEETIVNGRAQKLYTITEKGKERLKELRETWTNKVAFLTDIIPPEKRPIPPFHLQTNKRALEIIREIETKDEMLEYLQGYRDHFDRRIKHLEKRIANTKSNLSLINELTVEITKMEQYNSEKVEQLIKERLEKF
ncbi:MAG: PadR family transcriptional regulator [Candidatus Heimdallarchaeota archaeon]|nr:PadR family transcriptional regulator [Candidatus Heimdallarchaeota archaeon]